MMKQYYLITSEEICELIDLSEDIIIEHENASNNNISIVDLARKRIDLINLVKTRPHIVHEDETEPLIYDIEDVRFVAEEPPDYEDCPCWMPPADPEGTTGTCEGDGGDCKLWYFYCPGKHYTQCSRFSKECNNCLEILCKFRKV